MRMEKPQIVNQNVDTLKMGFICHNLENYDKYLSILDLLDGKKKEAQDIKGYGDRKILCDLGLGLGKMWVNAKGNSRYSYIIETADVTILCGRIKFDANMPHMRVEYHSKFLQTVGVRHCFALVQKIVSRFLGGSVTNIVSELHLNTDVSGAYFEELDQYRFYSSRRGVKHERDVEMSSYYRLRFFEGYSFGQGSPLLWRFYDKSLEIAKKINKQYIRSIWMQNGWDGESNVLRFEVQFRRDEIKRFIPKHYKGSEFELLSKRLDQIWFYGCSKMCIIDFTEEEIRDKVMDWGSKTLRNEVSKYRKSGEKLDFYLMISAWNLVDGIDLEVYRHDNYKSGRQAVIKQFLSFLTSYAKNTEDDFADIGNIVEEAWEHLLETKQFDFVDYMLVSRLQNFVTYTKYIMNDEVIPDETYNFNDGKEIVSLLKAKLSDKIPREASSLINQYQKLEDRGLYG